MRVCGPRPATHAPSLAGRDWMLGRVGLRHTSHLVGDTHEGHALAAGLFRVDKAFFHAGYDLLVLTGAIERVPVQAGMCVVLRGESDSTHVVPIASLEYVEFTEMLKLDGKVD